MDFELTQDQIDFRSAVEDFTKRELNSGLGARDRDAVFDLDAWRKCAVLGLQGLPVPVEYGGSGADMLSTVLALEALGYGYHDNGLIFSLHAHMWAGEMPILRFGSEEQKRRYLPSLCDGSAIIGHAMSEPGAGSDVGGLRTTAEPVGDGFVLTGTKTFVTNAPIADVFLVFATTAPGRGWTGLCAFLVDRDTPGLTVGPAVEKMGLRTSAMADVHFDQCVISRGNLLGPPGAGMAVFNWTMTRERGLIMASALGTMRRDLESSLEYAKNRRQFDQPIGSFQAVADRLVGMRLRLETARWLQYRVAWLFDQGKPVGLEASLAKLHLSECFVASGMDAIQVHGGAGYLSDLGIERDLRDAIGSRLYSGTTEIQKNLVARAMGL